MSAPDQPPSWWMEPGTEIQYEELLDTFDLSQLFVVAVQLGVTLRETPLHPNAIAELPAKIASFYWFIHLANRCRVRGDVEMELVVAEAQTFAEAITDEIIVRFPSIANDMRRVRQNTSYWNGA